MRTSHDFVRDKANRFRELHRHVREEGDNLTKKRRTKTSGENKWKSLTKRRKERQRDRERVDTMIHAIPCPTPCRKRINAPPPRAAFQCKRSLMCTVAAIPAQHRTLISCWHHGHRTVMDKAPEKPYRSAGLKTPSGFDMAAYRWLGMSW